MTKYAVTFVDHMGNMDTMFFRTEKFPHTVTEDIDHVLSNIGENGTSKTAITKLSEIIGRRGSISKKEFSADFIVMVDIKMGDIQFPGHEIYEEFGGKRQDLFIKSKSAKGYGIFEPVMKTGKSSIEKFPGHKLPAHKGESYIAFVDICRHQTNVKQHSSQQYVEEIIDLFDENASSKEVALAYIAELSIRDVDAEIIDKMPNSGWYVYIPSATMEYDNEFSIKKFRKRTDTVTDLIKDGWKMVKTVGDFQMYSHPNGKTYATVSVHSGEISAFFDSLANAEFDLWALEHQNEIVRLGCDTSAKLKKSAEEESMTGIDLTEALKLPKEEGTGSSEYIGEKYTVAKDKMEGL